MKKIIFHADGFGDLLVCFKAIYALKMLYPQYKLILLHSGNALSDKEFLRNINFIDEVMYESQFFEKLQKLDPQIFVSTRRDSAFFRELQKLHLKKVVVYPHFYSVVRTNFLTPLFFRGKKHMSECVLQLVRKIDKRHFDENFPKLDFNKVKDFLPSDENLTNEFLKGIKKYEKIIGINAFSNFSERSGVNFFIKDWIILALNLAKQYPNFLFVLLNFEENCIQYNIAQNTNIKVFVNNHSIASLVSISKKLDYLITIDTGNLHICDILQIPTLAFTRKLTAFRFSGGSYGGGEFDNLIVKPGWQKKYQEVFDAFSKKAFEKIKALK